LRTAIDEEDHPDVRDALLVALSSIIVRVSRQDGETRYAAVDNTLGEMDVRRAFSEAARSIDFALQNTWDGLFRPGAVKILNRDILDVEPKDIGARVSLVITSPPYPNAYEYWLYHKYRMYWLGMDPIAVREREIGARPHYFKRDPQTAADFESQMRRVFKLLSGVVVPGGHACFQIGRSVIRGEHIDNAALLVRAAESNGFVQVTRMERQIPRTRKSFNPSHARIGKEDILVFRLATP
jgi:site-specific DNA-methyltransferase (cytosine-N4-specific)